MFIDKTQDTTVIRVHTEQLLTESLSISEINDSTNDAHAH